MDQAKLTFKEVDAFCAASRGFDVDFYQLDPGLLEAELSFFSSADCEIQHFRFSRRFHQTGSGPADLLTFGLADFSTLRNWKGQSIESPRLLNFNGPNGYHSISDPGFSGYTFAISEKLLEQALFAFGSEVSTSALSSFGDWQLSGAGEMASLKLVSERLLHDDLNTPQSSEHLQDLQSALAHQIAGVVTSGEAITERASARQKSRVVKRALELIFSSSQRVLVSDLHKHTGVTWRTLDRIFKERFGIGPKQFIVAVRLAGVRKSLQSAQDHEKVTDIATRWGFTHMGRFSSSYSRLYGELPSQTRNRARDI